MEYESTGKLIQMLRREKGLTQKQLAEMLNITDKAVSKWERDIAYPDTATIPKLCEILEVSVEVLLNAKPFTSTTQNEDSSSTEDTISTVDNKRKEQHSFSRWLAAIALNSIGIITAILEIWRLVLEATKATLSILTKVVLSFLVLFGIIMTFQFTCGDVIREGWSTYTIIIMWAFIIVALIVTVLILPLLNVLLKVVFDILSLDAVIISLNTTCVNILGKTQKPLEHFDYSDISLVHKLIYWSDKRITPVIRGLLYLIIPCSLGYVGYWCTFIESPKPEYMGVDWWVAIALIAVCCVLGIYISRTISKALKVTSVISQIDATE